MNYKKVFLLLSIILFISSPLFAQASFEYKLLETIPGFFNSGQSPDFNSYIQAIYKFAIWAVGISALLMISIGAFMYLTSAGNNAAMSNAKEVITDAIIGLILALVAWLLLNTINPELVSPQGISMKSPATEIIIEI